MSIPGLATSPHQQYEPDALVIRTLLNRKAALLADGVLEEVRKL
jgi:hypothetical protein